MRAAWPAPNAAVDAAALEQFEALKQLVRGVRNARTEYGLEAARKVVVNWWGSGGMAGRMEGAGSSSGEACLSPPPLPSGSCVVLGSFASPHHNHTHLHGVCVCLFFSLRCVTLSMCYGTLMILVCAARWLLSWWCRTPA